MKARQAKPLFAQRSLGLTLGLAMALAVFSSVAQARSDARLQSIKQQTLALYTLRLADQRQFSDSAMILLAQEAKGVHVRRVRLWLNERLQMDLSYSHTQAQRLHDSGVHQMAVRDLPQGEQQVKIQVDVSAANSASTTVLNLETEQSLNAESWPRGLVIRLHRPDKNQAPKILVHTQAKADHLLKAADYELAAKKALKALTLLQKTAHIDPLISRQSEYKWRLADSLHLWDLDRAAEEVYSQLARSDQKIPARRAAVLAAKLALDRQDYARMDEHLARVGRFGLGEEMEAAKLLDAQRLLAQGDLDKALARIPSDGPALLRYNLAAALYQSGAQTRAVELLRDIAQSSVATVADADIQDLAKLKLGYHHLRTGKAGPAYQSFNQMRGSSESAQRGLLGRGWAALAALSTESVHQPGDFRPGFVQAANAALDRPGDHRAHLRRALESWLILIENNPLDEAVQEALAATAYALGRMGADKQALHYGEVAVQRLTAVNTALQTARRKVQSGKLIEAQSFSREYWPPYPSRWADLNEKTQWWKSDKLSVPSNALRNILLQQGETLDVLQAMHLLDELSGLLRAIAEHPDLKARAEQMRKSLDAERKAQQQYLNRFCADWLDEQIAQVRRYLMMSRLGLAQAYERVAEAEQ